MPNQYWDEEDERQHLAWLQSMAEGDDWIPEYDYEAKTLHPARRLKIAFKLLIHRLRMRVDAAYAKSINDIPF